MSNLLICYPACTTCQKARKWLDAHGLSYESRDIKLQNPTAAELARWIEQSGLPIKRFFNTSGLRYQALHLRERLPGMSEPEQVALLATDGMLVRRPLWIGGGQVLVGFRESEWSGLLTGEDAR